jgi:hypothetical protein
MGEHQTTTESGHPDELVRSEARSAVETLAAHLDGRPLPHDPTGTQTGRIENFSERFLAWAWVARSIKERYGLQEPISTYAYDAVERGTNDPEMMDRLRAVQKVLDTQDLGAAQGVDEGLADLEDWPANLGAIGVIVETVVYMARLAARHSGVPLGDICWYLAGLVD